MRSILSVIKRRWYIVLCLFLLVGGGIYWRSRSTKPEETVYVGVKQSAIESTLEISGKVDAEKKAVLKFLAGGKLVDMPVSEGQTVKKYQRIASIDAIELQKNLELSLNDYLGTRADFDQGIDDRKDQALTDTLRRIASKQQYTLNKSVLSVELRDIALRNATLLSPIEGVVTRLPVKVVGVQVIATDGFEIVDPNSLFFSGEVDEADIGKVLMGATVRIRLDAYPDETLVGEVYRIGLVAQNSSRSSGSTVYPVMVRFQNPDIFKQRIGMNGTAKILLQEKAQAFVVPIESTIQRDGKNFIRVRSSGSSEAPVEREVILGIEGESDVEVVSGVVAGDEVVVPK